MGFIRRLSSQVEKRETHVRRISFLNRDDKKQSRIVQNKQEFAQNGTTDFAEDSEVDKSVLLEYVKRNPHNTKVLKFLNKQ